MSTVGRLAPPLALMGLIFYLSAQPNLSSGLGVWDFVLRKLAHMTEYGLLFFLWWRALGYARAPVAVGIAVAYAVSDEVHQSFVPGRHGAPADVLIDAAGVALALALTRRGRPWRRRAASAPLPASRPGALPPVPREAPARSGGNG